MSYAEGPPGKKHDTPTTRMGYSTGNAVKNKGFISNTPPTAMKPTKKIRRAG